MGIVVEKIRATEVAKDTVGWLAKIKGLMAEEDIIALFYSVCKDCAGGS